MSQEEVIPWYCACCKSCWLYVNGQLKGRCINHGPYKGYVIVNEKDPPPEASEDA